MVNVNIEVEKIYISQCPKCKRIYSDEGECDDCNIGTIEIVEVVTEVY